MLVFLCLGYVPPLHRIPHARYTSLQYGVTGYPQHIVEPIGIGQLVEPRTAEPAVRANRNPHGRIAIPNLADHPLQYSDIPPIGMTITRPQDRNNDLAGLPVMKEELIIHKLPIKPVKHTQLLAAMGWVISGIDIDDNLASGLQGIRIAVYPAMTYREQRAFIYAVIEAAERGLGDRK